MSTAHIFRDFKTSPETKSLAVMVYDRSPLSPRIAEGGLQGWGICITYQTARFQWNRGPGRSLQQKSDDARWMCHG